MEDAVPVLIHFEYKEDIRSPIPTSIPVLARHKGGYVTAKAASWLNPCESK